MKLVWLVVVVLFLAVGYFMMRKVEQPEYSIITSQHDIEIRSYAKKVIISTQVSGNRTTALSKGFKLLADYIFGDNIQNMKIAMTAPVIEHYDKGWWVSFFAPNHLDLSNLPKPNNTKVKFKYILLDKVGVIKFSGVVKDSLLQKKEQELRTYLASNNYKVIGKAYYAFYNPPWVLPMFRRNEVILKIE